MKVSFYCGDYDSALEHDHTIKNAYIPSFGKKIGFDIYRQTILFFEECYIDDSKKDSIFNVFTNNDHYFNALRFCVGSGILNTLDVKIFFYPADTPYPTEIFIDKFGSCSHWPLGFFDGFDKALDDIIQIRFKKQ